MNTLPDLSLNEIYRHYLDVYFHPTKLSEPRLTRSELERALKLSPTVPENAADAAGWLALLAPAWLQGEVEAEPFPQHPEANRRWQESLRSRREEREATLRKMVELAED